MKENVSKKRSVLFVCKANCFRSYSADYLFKAHLAKLHESGFSVSSAGTNARGGPYPKTTACVKALGGDPTGHVPRPITSEIVSEQDIIVCFSKWHQDFLMEHFSVKSFLFNDLAYGKKEDLMDDDEYGQHHGWDFDLDKFIDMTVHKIYDGIPALYESLKKL